MTSVSLPWRPCRERIGREFIIVYRLSMLDLIEKGSSWDEIVQLAKACHGKGHTGYSL
jgi:2,4-dienoyl-CoA reductase (NADPH2)